MRARQATFVLSAPSPKSFPPPSHPEVAFAGRSNVGKSSLINALVGISRLAKTSSTPGRTRLLNWFEVLPPKGSEMLFVDLPGFGYAKVAKSMRASWRPLVEAYFNKRPTLRLTILLIDLRRGPEVEEIDLLAWLREQGLPALVVLTKADKLAKSKRKVAAFKVAKELGVPALAFSTKTGEGQKDLWHKIMRAVAETE